MKIYNILMVIAFSITAFSAVSQAQIPNLGDIVRDEKGKVQTVNQYVANLYCKLMGSRLPTTRELALYAQSLGAAGVSDTKINNDYYRVEAKSKDSTGNLMADFYFNPSGYKRPVGDLGSYRFWSSTGDSDLYAMQLDGKDGEFYLVRRDTPNEEGAQNYSFTVREGVTQTSDEFNNFAVRCIQ